MKSMVTYVHDRIKTYTFDTAIDFTLGQGFDTLFLMSLNKEVYSFDIQQIALDAFIDTYKDKLNDHVHLICDSHENFDQYIDTFDIGVFNLGYLPNSDHLITTTFSSTKIAIEKAVEKMNTALFIVVYIGHDEGKKESEWIDNFVSQLDNRYNVSCYKMLNKHNSPYVIEIERRKSICDI